MAGIGFRLQKILHKGSYYDLMKSFFYSVVVSSGPWLLSIIGIFVISVISPYFIKDNSLMIFKAVIVYTYAGTLIFTGIIQMGTTRYIADRFFVGEEYSLVPCFNFVSVVVIIVGGIISSIFHYFSGLQWFDAVAAVILFQAISLIWMAMMFLSAAKDYIAITLSFFSGYFVSVILAIVGSSKFGFTGILWGFTLGQIILSALLSVRIRSEFESENKIDIRVYKQWITMPKLALIGFCFNVGIWADKIVFWFSHYSIQLKGLFRATPGYDPCMFIGYITVFPAIALFMISIETSFYKFYSSFYEAVTHGEPLSSIKHEKEAMKESLRLSLAQLIGIQGFISFFFFMLAPLWLKYVKLSVEDSSTMRIAILASFIQILLLDLIILILYFDWQKEAAFLTSYFALSNIIFPIISSQFNYRFHALGYFSSCLTSLIIGIYIFNYRMERLEFETFTKQEMKS